MVNYLPGLQAFGPGFAPHHWEKRKKRKEELKMQARWEQIFAIHTMTKDLNPECVKELPQINNNTNKNKKTKTQFRMSQMTASY